MAQAKKTKTKAKSTPKGKGKTQAAARAPKAKAGAAKSDGLTNSQRLANAGLVDPHCLPEELAKFIDTQLTPAEVNHLIQGGAKLVEYTRQHPDPSLPTITF